jgi:hypothetical protein
LAMGDRLWAAFELGAGKRWRSRAQSSNVEHREGLDRRTG